MAAAVPSWIGSAKEPAESMAPVLGSMVDTVDNEDPPEVIPPRTVRPPPAATTASRETGAARCQGSTPASMESGPDGRLAGGWSAATVCAGGWLPPPDWVTITTITTIISTAAAVRRRLRRYRRARWVWRSTLPVPLLVCVQAAKLRSSFGTRTCPAGRIVVRRPLSLVARDLVLA